MSRPYRIHEFAELAGVTVKALRHYDRLGLLKPVRTPSGYRTYVECHLERLEQIVALKFLGVPLKQIKTILDRAEFELPEALKLQRKALEEKQMLLSRAIRAVRAAEESLESGKPANPAVLKRIIEVIDMQSDAEVMRKYYTTDDAWEKRRRYYEEGPSAEWRELFRDIHAAIGEHPGSEKAQGLADRYLALAIRAQNGDPEAQMDSGAAWMDRENWPPAMKYRITEFHLEEAREFIQQASVASRKKYFTEAVWAKLNVGNFATTWQDRVDLFHDAEAALPDGPESERGREVAARWSAFLDAISDGDPEVKAGLIETWADRRNWAATLRWREEALSRMAGERFDKVAEFTDKAVAA